MLSDTCFEFLNYDDTVGDLCEDIELYLSDDYYRDWYSPRTLHLAERVLLLACTDGFGNQLERYVPKTARLCAAVQAVYDSIE